MSRVRDEEIIRALYDVGGSVAQASALLGTISRPGIYSRIKRSPMVRVAAERARSERSPGEPCECRKCLDCRRRMGVRTRQYEEELARFRARIREQFEQAMKKAA